MNAAVQAWSQGTGTAVQIRQSQLDFWLCDRTLRGHFVSGCTLSNIAIIDTLFQGCLPGSSTSITRGVKWKSSRNLVVVSPLASRGSSSKVRRNSRLFGTPFRTVPGGATIHQGSFSAAPAPAVRAQFAQYTRASTGSCWQTALLLVVLSTAAGVRA